jgi:hypothetical protein
MYSWQIFSPTLGGLFSVETIKFLTDYFPGLYFISFPPSFVSQHFANTYGEPSLGILKSLYITISNSFCDSFNYMHSQAISDSCILYNLFYRTSVFLVSQSLSCITPPESYGCLLCPHILLTWISFSFMMALLRLWFACFCFLPHL